MNFYAHAVVAATSSRRPAFVLGAMLPDLVAMARTRLPALAEGPLRDGVEHHHRTDDAFHGSATFVAWCGRVRRALEAANVPRGPAMAVAHVGSELLLDGVLSRHAVDAAFRPALVVADREDLEPAIVEVCRRVEASDLPTAYRDAGFVTQRLDRILSARPRLALTSRALAEVEAVLHEQLGVIERDHARLLDEVLATLREPSPRGH